MNKPSRNDTSWQKVGQWYDNIVGYWGHHYHQQVIIPNVLRLLQLQKESRLLDLACGQGVLARHIPQDVSYVGVDGAKSLIKQALVYHAKDKERIFLHADITKPLSFPKDVAKLKPFTHSTILLALQNIQRPDLVLQELKLHLAPGGTLVFVLNHPCFRIPRQSHWGFDEATKIQYRRMNGYMSEQKIPIQAHPGKKESSDMSWSFHQPLSYYFDCLQKAGFVVTALEEWCSDKTSTGKAATWENRARSEFPLFLAIKASYQSQNHQ
ncbi:MAG: class I SAM-dependent methyltransferase [Verrucomicrobia bacterium]|nr:class I SAM-dependent methyltransferase [Verrucomicrobiota bacterium]